MNIGDELEAITADLWAAMFGSEFELSLGGILPTTRLMSCLVWINGEPQRAVLAQFPEELAAALTKALLGQGGTPDNAATIDAVGELGNILAGNLKACFPGRSRLSLPAVTSGTDYEIDTIGASEIAVRTFSTADQVFTVTVLEALPSDQGSNS